MGAEVYCLATERAAVVDKFLNLLDRHFREVRGHSGLVWRRRLQRPEMLENGGEGGVQLLHSSGAHKGWQVQNVGYPFVS